MSMKSSVDTIGNRTRDLPACSAVPQPTPSLRAPRDMSNAHQCLTRKRERMGHLEVVGLEGTLISRLILGMMAVRKSIYLDLFQITNLMHNSFIL